MPASGKSTYAKQLVDEQGYKRVNKDDLRAMIDNGKWSSVKERSVLKIRDDLVDSWLRDGYSVVVDDTNFNQVHIEQLKYIASFYKNVDINIELIDTPLYECIERDAKREKPVGRRVILNMYNQYLHKVPPVIPVRSSKPTCIIVDIDGTLAYMNGRTPYEYNKVSSDKPNINLSVVIEAIKSHTNTKVIVVSGREDSCRKETEDWLRGVALVDYDNLYMRKAGDMRDDTIVKEEIYNEFIKDKYEVLAVFDDRPKVVRMWQSLNLFVMQCGRMDHRIEF